MLQRIYDLFVFEKHSLDYRIFATAIVLAVVGCFYYDYSDLHCTYENDGGLIPDCMELQFEWKSFDVFQRFLRVAFVLWLGTKLVNYD